MTRTSSWGGWFAAVAALLSAPIGAASPAPMRLERVALLMRHGIRPPTSAQPLPKAWTSEAWPDWPVDYGLLTPRGAAGIRLLGAADRAFYRSQGLFGTGCPEAGAVTITASVKPRAFDTATAWRDAFAPGCPLSVSHPHDGAPDAMFHPLDGHPTTFDGERAYREAVAAEPAGGLTAELGGFRGDFLTLARVLGCRTPSCPALAEPSGIRADPHGRPKLTGPADAASSAAETFLLEYLEGKSMSQVGWGRITRPEIEALLRFHPLEFRYSSRPPSVAAAAAGPLARAMAAALADPSRRIALFAGHDTNIADLGGLLDLHWHVPSYPADDIPPGGALGFEVWRNAEGMEYIRAFFRAQTMDDLRDLRPFDSRHQPYRGYLPIPGCGNSPAATTCTLPRFLTLLQGVAGR